jgi:hypothetical protein
MLTFYKRGWNNVWQNLNRSAGYRIPNTNYVLMYRADSLCLYKYKQNINDYRTENYILQIGIGRTDWCCGVAQFGRFVEFAGADDVPDDILQHMFNVAVSIARNSYNKGVVQGWFYRTPRSKKYQHPIIFKMFTNAGMKQIGRQSYNPNSYNTIKGLQATINKKGKAYGRA